MLRGEHPTISSIARAAGVGRKFIYEHPELLTAIEHEALKLTEAQVRGLTSSARVTNASLRADLENSRTRCRILIQGARARAAALRVRGVSPP